MDIFFFIKRLGKNIDKKDDEVLYVSNILYVGY